MGDFRSFLFLAIEATFLDEMTQHLFFKDAKGLKLIKMTVDISREKCEATLNSQTYFSETEKKKVDVEFGQYQEILHTGWGTDL